MRRVFALCLILMLLVPASAKFKYRFDKAWENPETVFSAWIKVNDVLKIGDRYYLKLTDVDSDKKTASIEFVVLLDGNYHDLGLGEAGLISREQIIDGITMQAHEQMIFEDSDERRQRHPFRVSLTWADEDQNAAFIHISRKRDDVINVTWFVKSFGGWLSEGESIQSGEYTISMLTADYSGTKARVRIEKDGIPIKDIRIYKFPVFGRVMDSAGDDIIVEFVDGKYGACAANINVYTRRALACGIFKKVTAEKVTVPKPVAVPEVTPAPTPTLAPPIKPKPEISVSKQAYETELNPGESTRIIVILKNNGEGLAKNLRISDMVPPAFMITSGTNVWSLDSLAPGQSTWFFYSISSSIPNVYELPQASVSYQDEEGNYYHADSNKLKITVKKSAPKIKEEKGLIQRILGLIFSLFD
ncbi:MAG: hypothetical protein ACE5K4_10230 [Candidatus Hydrothermarchaeota archaeon]